MLSQIGIGLFRSLGVMSLVWAFLGGGGGEASTQLDPDPPDPPTTDTCIGCHPAIGEDWANNAHGQAATNDAFIEVWNEEGNLPVCMTCHSTGYDATSLTWESPGVSCLTCHSPVNENHPDEIMPTDLSPRVCGNCHLETFVEFQDSAHGRTGQNCFNCHNPHTTGLKTETSQAACQTCHKERVHSFELTVHASKGIQCADCHLAVEQTELGTGHGTRRHTFQVSLETCVGCHGESMHNSVQVVATEPQAVEDALVTSFPAQPSLRTEPVAANLIGFVILGPLVGLGVGMVIAPWLEKWVRRFRNTE